MKRSFQDLLGLLKGWRGGRGRIWRKGRRRKRDRQKIEVLKSKL